MYYSYVMGIDHSIEQLKQNGFTVEKDGANYTVAFSKELAGIWEAFIGRHLELEYWNEYLTEDGVVFLFHLEDGLRRYEVKNYENEDVLKLCERLCNRKFKSIKTMLAGNHFYKDKIG